MADEEKTTAAASAPQFITGEQLAASLKQRDRRNRDADEEAMRELVQGLKEALADGE